MNIRAGNFHEGPAAPAGARPTATFRNPAGGGRLPRAAIVPVAARVSAIFFDETAGSRAAGAKRRLTASRGGRAIERPFLATRLALADGGCRHVLIAGRPAEALAASPMTLHLDGVPAAALDPEWLQSPITGASALTAGLSAGGRNRLLQVLMTTGASLFGLAAADGYGAITGQLLSLLGARRLPLASLCPAGAAGQLLTFRCDPKEPVPGIRALVLERLDRSVTVKGFETFHEITGQGALLHVFLPAALPPGSRLAALAERPLILDGPAPDTEPRPLGLWLARRPEPAREWLRAILGRAAASGPAARALLREISTPEALRPALEVLHLSATPGGLLHALALRDEEELIRAVRIECGGETREIPRCTGPGGGYLPWPGRAAGPCRLQLVHHSARVRTVAEITPEIFDGRAPEAFRALEPARAAGALARAREDGLLPMRRRGTELRTFGERPARVRLSLVAPEGRNPDMLRARAGAVFGQKLAREAEIVTYATGARTRQRPREIHAIFGLHVRALTLSGDWPPADALRAALAEADGEVTLVLGADVLPEGGDWLAGWLRQVRGPGAAIVGGTLLGIDGAVLDAGGGIGESGRLVRRGAGLPACDMPARPSAPTRLVTAQCAALSREAKAIVLASPCPHPDPCILLTDAARRVAEGGGSVRTSFRNRCTRYGGPADPDPLSVAADALSGQRAATGTLRQTGCDSHE